ncbi:MAG: dihydrodipicolinate synthase family protein [Betaproteobacteria bacterium]|nr:dihydrodipicolinate synthase family protein [Betaproteobacteria bacterium]
MAQQKFSGVIPILATPFNDDESLDLASWQRMIEFMVALKVDGITILGVLGESNRLSDHERETLIKSAVATVATGGRRIPVIVGTSHTGTAAATFLSRMAEDLGADAVMVTPAREPVPNDERIVEYYRRIGEGMRLPIVLQDHPASTDVHMSAPLILRIVKEVASIACIKAEAVPTPAKIRALRAGLSRPVPILSGLGALYAPFDLEAGSEGFNTGFAFPEVLRALLDAAQANDFDRVHALYARFAALITFEQQPGLAIRKEILRQRGLITCNRVRHPGATITPVVAAEVAALITRTLPGVDITQTIAL